MLKKRVVILLTFLDGVLFRTKRFVADYRYTQSQLCFEGADEVACIHLGGDWSRFCDSVGSIADTAFTPLSVGGKIHRMEQISALFRDLPVDKVILGPGGWKIARKAASKWGAQSIVCGFTVGRDRFPRNPDAFGEFLIQSLSHDGSLGGYDLDRIRPYFDRLDVPVVVGSGCGSWQHMVRGFKAGADACATNNIFHFTERALSGCKAYLEREGIDVRL